MQDGTWSVIMLRPTEVLTPKYPPSPLCNINDIYLNEMPKEADNTYLNDMSEEADDTLMRCLRRPMAPTPI